MAAQQIPQAKKPDPPPAPPPPPPPPPAIPPVLNPYGVHFQPPVPATDMGPMVHHYVPRYDNGIPNAGPEMCYPVQQAPVAMATPMQPLQPVGMVPVAAPMTAPINPIVMQQPVVPPMVIQGGPMPPCPAAPGQPFMLQMPAQPGNIPPVPGLPVQPPVHVEPALGVGLTPSETVAQNVRIAQNNRCNEPQDFVPADPDPHRLYWLRELNGHWAIFSRRQIDRLNARWYRTDQGAFYAVRLSD